MFVSFVMSIACAFSLFTAISSFLTPARFAGLLGLQLNGPDGANEVRAQYGGFFCAVAVVQIAALCDAISSICALIVLVVVFGGLLAGRLAGLAIDRNFGRYGSTIRLLFAIDAVGFALSIAALRIISIR